MTASSSRSTKARIRKSGSRELRFTASWVKTERRTKRKLKPKRKTSSRITRLPYLDVCYAYEIHRPNPDHPGRVVPVADLDLPAAEPVRSLRAAVAEAGSEARHRHGGRCE